jgi:type IV pilus biogenesis protein CpaD/CtpE
MIRHLPRLSLMTALAIGLAACATKKPVELEAPPATARPEAPATAVPIAGDIPATSPPAARMICAPRPAATRCCLAMTVMNWMVRPAPR